MDPELITPGGSGTSPMIASAVIDFPQPDSPTIPRILFSLTESEI